MNTEQKAVTDEGNVPHWKRMNDLPNLRALQHGEETIGFVYRLSPESQWVCHTGIGDSAKMIGHEPTLQQAKMIVEVATGIFVV